MDTVNNVIRLRQFMLMNESLFSLHVQKEMLLNFGGFTTTIEMIETTLLDKICALKQYTMGGVGIMQTIKNSEFCERLKTMLHGIAAFAFSDLQWEMI